MIYVVTGTMRSGTSLMMRAFEASGVPVVKSEVRDHINARLQLNPVSLYEPSVDDRERVGFPRMYDGHAVKLVVSWLPSLAVHEYRVLVMRRNPEAIMDSRAAGLGEHWSFARRAAWVREYPARMAETIRGLENRRDVHAVSIVDFERLLASPRVVFEGLAEAGFPLVPDDAARVVDPLWRAA